MTSKPMTNEPMRDKPQLLIVVAAAENNAIGKDNKLLWHLPADLRHFKNLTTGKTIIMGRKTFESIGKALPNRRNIVVSRSSSDLGTGIEIAASIDEAIAKCAGEDQVCIIGGAEIYKEVLSQVDTVYLTRVHGHFDADTFFPLLEPSEWETLSSEPHLADEKNSLNYTFFVLERK